MLPVLEVIENVKLVESDIMNDIFLEEDTKSQNDQFRLFFSNIQ